MKTFVGGTKPIPRENPTDAGTRNVRRRLVVPKGMRKMNVADEDGENKGTIEKYFANMRVKGMLMNGGSFDSTKETERDPEKDDDKEDVALGKKLKISTTNPGHKTAKKTTGVPKLKESRGQDPELGKSLATRG